MKDAMGAVPSCPHPISTEICRNFLTIESVMLCSASFDDCDLCSNIVFKKKKETNINQECEILMYIKMFMNAWPYYVSG